ncbi:glycerophosphodiester phosphodiesterase family protein [Desulforhopalus sp. IMCC35007]|uniref:glycerophosphodiester phosphodiesterase family protein n=1 Tax=Desulforhopalus sp. IMCC35007 TaxID=2569543 RepID=UPI00145CD37D|nr:glycerophosphodiester phosphodiesterase family protein [Desulforhopalus sp. IMCC35007]
MTKIIPPLVAHRGASHVAPENTLPAYRRAFLEGADSVEGDFWLTADDQIVCIHDPTTKRTAPHQPVMDIRTSRLKELEHIDVGLWKSTAYRGTPIPELTEILNELPAGMKLYVEIKQNTPKIIDAMLLAAQRSSINLSQLCLISFSEEIIQRAKQRNPWLTAYLLHSLKPQIWNLPAKNYLQKIIARAVASGADGLDLGSGPLIDRWFVDSIRQAGLEFHVWTVNNADEALRYIELGVDSITTDRPQGLRLEITERLGRL